MSIKSHFELDKLRIIGRIVRKPVDEMAEAARPGVTTAELNEIGAKVLAESGAESGSPKV
jgi:methionyl aminopeptidase